MPSTPLGGDAIRAYVEEAAEALPDGERHMLIIVGGSLLAWHNLRGTTADVDSVRKIEPSLRVAVAAVAQRHDLSPDWLNDRAAMFTPQTFLEDECEILLDSPKLLVLAMPWPQAFLMKLYRFEAQDREDLVAMWNLTGFDSPDQVARLFKQAYPHAPDDPYLANAIADIAVDAEAERST